MGAFAGHVQTLSGELCADKQSLAPNPAENPFVHRTTEKRQF